MSDVVGEDRPNDRGAAPLIGIVLLFGMVFAGAAIVGFAGMMLIDSLEADSERERVLSSVDTAQQGISTVTNTYNEATIPWKDASFSDDGSVYVVWYNESESGSLDPGGDTAVHIDSLGAIEYDTDDGTVAYQGGGTWVETDSDTLVRSSPDILADDTLSLNFVTLDEDSVQGAEARVSASPDREIEAELEEALSEARTKGFTDLALVVESEYHDGWYRHLESTFGSDNVSSELDALGQNDSVTESFDVDSSRAIVATQSDTFESRPAFFWVESDDGMNGDEYAQTNRLVVPYQDQNQGEMIPGQRETTFEATIKNTGDRTDTQDIELWIPALDIENDDDVERNVSLSDGERNDIAFEITPGQIQQNIARDKLQSGETYEYQIRTEDDSTSDGSFYFTRYEDPWLTVSTPDINGHDASDANSPVTVTDETVNITVDVHNIGATDATEEELELIVNVPAHSEDDPYDLVESETPVVNRSYGENKSVSWELNRSDLLEAEHEFVIEPENGDAVTGYFDVENAVDVGEADIVFDPGTEVNVSVIGSELSSHGLGENRWLPTYVNVFTQEVDENNEPVEEEPVQHTEMDWYDTNINTHDDRLEQFEYNFTTEERVSLMLQATSYLECAEPVVGREGGWVYQDTIDGIAIYDCPTGSERNEHVDLTADVDTEESNVRVLNETRNTMPELEPGADVQLRADELLQREDVDIPVTQNTDPDVYDGQGYDLQLEENEFVFLFEITHHPEQYNDGPHLPENVDWTNERYWQEAFDRQGGDPNFNDVIAHVEIDPPEEPADFAFDGVFTDTGGDALPIGPGNSDESPGGVDGGEADVDVGTDEIIIG